ncbi:transposable element Tcb2 transposase [Trichonephila clavipes]|nr:transposable element Tcb2 transposase [Trichonephila clavipes]
MWNVTDWQKVVFSDESRFVLGTDDNRVRVWRRPAYDSRSTLIVMRGILTGQRYVDDILRSHVGPFLKGLPGAILQQDNARPHTARVSQDFLRHFHTLPWPTRSLFFPCRARDLGSNPGECIDVCVCIVPLRHGGTLNSRRAACFHVRLVESEERKEASDHLQDVLTQIWSGTQPNLACLVLKATDNNRRTS